MMDLYLPASLISIYLVLLISPYILISTIAHPSSILWVFNEWALGHEPPAYTEITSLGQLHLHKLTLSPHSEDPRDIQPLLQHHLDITPS